jgi:hypothetical protein
MIALLLVLVTGCSSPETPPVADAGGCVPDTTSCEGSDLLRCAPDGIGFERSTCPDACDPEEGCVSCVPGTWRCDGTRSERCSSDRAWVLVRDCERWGSTCGSDGLCDDACALPESTSDYLGCEYQVVRTPRSPSSATVTAVLGNPSAELAEVEVVQDGMVSHSIMIEAGEVAVLPISFPDDFETARITKTDSAWIRATRPLVATQVFPFEDDGSYSADSSLLLPRHSFGTEHIVASYAPLSFVAEGVMGDDLGYTPNTYGHTRSTLTIAAPPTEGARVVVRPRAPLQADSTGRVPFTEAGGVLHLELARGETVHLFAADHPRCSRDRPSYAEYERLCFTEPPELGGARHCLDPAFCPETGFDLTGTEVTSDVPVGVFGGHECAFVPVDRYACDHLEEQMPPVSMWGREHVSIAVGSDGADGPNRVRVIASVDETVITIEPPQDGVSTATLARGQWVELTVQGVFRITSPQPILVSQYLYGQDFDAPEGARRGDPSMWIVPPVEQYQDAYSIALPASYLVENNGALFLAVVRSAGDAIAMDGSPLELEVTGTAGGYEAAIVRVEAGSHKLSASEPFALIAIGMSDFTSFASAAGRGVRILLL